MNSIKTAPSEKGRLFGEKSHLVQKRKRERTTQLVRMRYFEGLRTNRQSSSSQRTEENLGGKWEMAAYA